MARGRGRTRAVPQAPRGLDVRRYRSRPAPRKVPGKNGSRRWETFRIVKVAIRLLAWLRLPINPAAVTNATAFLAIGMKGFRRVPEKTILENDLCRCLYEGWKTTKPHRRAVARPAVSIPRSLMDKSAAELRIMVVGLQQALAKSEKGRLQAIAAQRGPKPAQPDSLSKRIAELAAMARTAAEPATADGRLPA